MDLKPLICLFASFLVLTSRVSSKDESFLAKGIYVQPPVAAPVKPPTLVIPTLPPPPPKVPVVAPTPLTPVLPPPPQAPIKPPTPVTPAIPLPPKAPIKPPTPVTPALPLPPKAPIKPPTPVTPVLPLPPKAPIKPPTPVTPAPAPAPTPPKTRLDCIPLCVERCKLHSRKKLCARACMTCCERCKCVPPGTYGNREKCGKCYTDMTTKGGKSKCP